MQQPERHAGGTNTRSRLNPIVTVGLVQFTPVSHVLVLTLLAALSWATLEPNPARIAAFGLSPATGVGLVLLAYVILQTGRIVHEAGRALASVRTGRKLRALRLTPLLMMTDWPPDELWRAPDTSRRVTAAAGTFAQMLFGAVLLLAAGSAGSHWAAPVQEAVFLCGVFHLAGLANLLPTPDSDGHILFGAAWRTRPSWLVVLAATVAQIVVPLAITAVRFDQGLVRAYVTSMTAPSNLVPLVLAFLILPFVARRHLFPPR